MVNLTEEQLAAFRQRREAEEAMAASDRAAQEEARRGRLQNVVRRKAKEAGIVENAAQSKAFWQTDGAGIRGEQPLVLQSAGNLDPFSSEVLRRTYTFPKFGLSKTTGKKITIEHRLYRRLNKRFTVFSRFDREITHEALSISGLLAPGWGFPGPLQASVNFTFPSCSGYLHETGPFAGESACAGGGIEYEVDPAHPEQFPTPQELVDYEASLADLEETIIDTYYAVDVIPGDPVTLPPTPPTPPVEVIDLPEFSYSATSYAQSYYGFIPSENGNENRYPGSFTKRHYINGDKKTISYVDGWVLVSSEEEEIGEDELEP